MEKNCLKIREDILKISHASGHGHLPTCFSVVELLWALYEGMQHDSLQPEWPERDLFVLSKGHAALGYYCVLAAQGYFQIEDVYSFGGFGAQFGCHADRFKIPGVEASTGSLGHGIGLAVGMALARRIYGKPGNVYTLIGDGESNEGTVWEALLVAANLGLNNLTIIYDNNQSHERGLQVTGPVAKFSAFGCDVLRVNGHDLQEIKGALQTSSEKVKVLVADTVKGYGCQEMEKNHYTWHRRSPSEQELTDFITELHSLS